MIELIPCALRSRVREVRRRRAVNVRVEDGCVPQAELPGREARVRLLHGAHSARDDRVRGLLHVPERSELREQVLEVPADARVLVRPDERDVRIRVHARELAGELGDDRAPHAGVAHGDVCVWLVGRGCMREVEGVPALMKTILLLGAEASATMKARLRWRMCSPVSVWPREA